MDCTFLTWWEEKLFIHSLLNLYFPGNHKYFKRLPHCFCFFICSERVHLHPRGSGRCPDRKCLLGALLPRARRRSGRRLPGQSHTTELSWRPVQHLLQHRELWASCPQSVICGPGAHCGWWVVLCVCLFLPSLSLFFYYSSSRSIMCGRAGLHPHSSCR